MSEQSPEYIIRREELNGREVRLERIKAVIYTRLLGHHSYDEAERG